EDFIALHIRGADIIYGDYYKKWSLQDFVGDKVFPYEIALEIIKRHTNANVKIIIFGQDVKSNMKLLNYIIENKILPKNKIFTVDEFINQTFNIFERTFFEMNLMSHALKIYTPGIQAQKSAFSQCAMMIAGRKNIISYHEIFSLKQQYQI
ncbi:sugar transferase, partial [Campylobacter jejuni]